MTMRIFLKISTLLLVIVTCFAETQACYYTITTASGTHAPKTICAGDLIFEDNFSFLDFEKWEHENTLSGGGNWEFQWYNNNRTNSFVKNDRLHIRPSLLSDQFGEEFLTKGTLNIHGGSSADKCTNAAWYGCERQGTTRNILNPIKSARIRTINSFSFLYGKVEFSAKMPAGDWLWPAIMLMPTNNVYGTWPASGEIDLVESRGNKKLVLDNINIGVEQVRSTLHFGPYGPINGWERAHFKNNDPAGYHSKFKKYQMEWTPNYINFSIDDRLIGSVVPDNGGFWKIGNFDKLAPNTENPWKYGGTMAPFDQEFHIVMNLAIGGVNYFPDDASNPDTKPWNNHSPTAMRDFYERRAQWLETWKLNENDGIQASLLVEYVKVWAL